MSQTSVEHRSAQPFSTRDVVGGGAGPPAQDGHDDPEADHDLGGGDHEHEEHDGLAADVVEHRGRR